MKEQELKAIERLRLAGEMSKTYYHKPLVITYSGGKDSECLLRLAEKSGIKFEVVNSHTTVDAPCTVYHIRKVFGRCERTGIKSTILMPYDNGQRTNMWRLIYKNGIPTRLKRFCCKYLKETSIPNRYIAMGIRASESNGRKSRTEFEVRGKTKKDKKLYDINHTRSVFNDAIRIQKEIGEKDNNKPNVWDCTLITNCKENKDVIVNPIIDWSDRDVWDYIRSENIEINPIYEHFDRCGCILCPMGSYCQKKKQISLFPQYKENYIAAFDRHIKKRRERGLREIWKDGRDCFDWWIEEYKHQTRGQMSFEDLEEGE